MILVRTPLRICIGGGGTDLSAYASKHGGYVVSAALDKFVYVILNRHFGDNYLLKYSMSEQVSAVYEIQHPVVRAIFKLLGIEGGVEMTTFMDVPGRTGLGSSSSFTVGLLQAAYTLIGQIVSKRELAEKAMYVERVLLKEAGGVQDQFIAAYGGVQVLEIDKTGNVDISPLDIAPDVLHDLEGRLMIFYTGIQRESYPVQAEVTNNLQSGEKTVGYLHKVKEIGKESAKALLKGDLDEFGHLMDLHWHEKRRMADSISSTHIDELYELGKRHGALGGKLIGAGGGGFLMFYCPGNRTDLREAMLTQGLRELRFRFDDRGSTVVANLS